jgi:AcrR family transcriptional regulator
MHRSRDNQFPHHLFSLSANSSLHCSVVLSVVPNGTNACEVTVLRGTAASAFTRRARKRDVSRYVAVPEGDGFMQRGKKNPARTIRERAGKPVRDRVLSAAFTTFRDRGFSGASTLEIATRARVSKRELYTLFDDKHAMLAACIVERTERMRAPLQLPTPQSRGDLAATLTAFGTAVLRGVCNPNVLAVYRLAIAESERSPSIARTLEDAGRQTNRAAIIGLLEQAQAHGVLRAGDAAPMAELFFASLWGDLLVRLLLRVIDAPTLAEAEHRAGAATHQLLTLYAGPR